MESNETLVEMQEQIVSLQQSLENQKNLNKQLLLESYYLELETFREKLSYSILGIFFGMAVIGCGLGKLPDLSVLIFELCCVIGIIGSLLETRHIPDKKTDLISAEEGLKKTKRKQAKSAIFSIPLAAIMWGCFTWGAATLVQEFKVLMIITIVVLCILFIAVLVAAFILSKEATKTIDRLLNRLEQLRQLEE